MAGYSHLTAEERDRLADLKADGLSLQAIARALGRAASTISREIGRNALESGAYRPHLADGAYMLRRQRRARLETDAKLAAYVTDRLAEGWTPEQVAGRLRLGIEVGLRAVCAETIYGWIYRAGQKTERLWRFLTRHHARRRKRRGRASRDTIPEKTHISQRSGDADARATVGHWEADLVICKRSRPVLVMHERKTRITLMARLAGKTAAETIAAMTADLPAARPAHARLGHVRQRHLLRPPHAAARHALGHHVFLRRLRQLAEGRRRERQRPHPTMAATRDGPRRDQRAGHPGDRHDHQSSAWQRFHGNLEKVTPRKCLGYRSPVEAFLSELGKDVAIRFA